METSKQGIERFIVSVRKTQRNFKPVKPTGKVAAEGLRVSKQALQRPEEIALTPYGKNMYMKFDHKDENAKLLVGDPVTKAELYLEAQTLPLLYKYCGKEQLEYDTSKPVWDYNNYCVDCWRNFKRGAEVRHAVPNMNEARLKAFNEFKKPIKDVDIIGYLKDPLFMKAVDFVLECIPRVHSAKEWRTVNLPFQTKHSNTGYPDYRNDQAIDKSTGLTYGKLVDQRARHKTPQEVAGYPFVAFGRNLRGKARPIAGGSREQALVFNQLEAEEIQAYKTASPFFIGYNDDVVLKEKMVKIGKWIELHPGTTCFNRDYDHYDTTVPPSLRTLASALRYLRAIDPKAKEIAFWRAVSQNKAYLVNGLDNSIELIFARIFSGEIDTNLGGGLAQVIVDIYSILKQDPNWIDDIARPLIKCGASPILVMGDDNLIVHLASLVESVYANDLKRFNLIVSKIKGEYGLFFGQKRVYKLHNLWFIIVPFTRVIRQLFSKENKKGLGPAGWTLATYMNLAQLIERPDILVDVAKIFLPFDKYKLGTIWSVDELKQLVAKEDRESKASQGKRAMTTAERLYDGDPLKARFFSSDNKHLDFGPVEKIHALLCRKLPLIPR